MGSLRLGMAALTALVVVCATAAVGLRDRQEANALLYKGDVRSLIENARGGSGADSMGAG